MTNTEIVTRLLLAVFFGALIGLEREWRGHAAGLRTHAMVSMGSALIMITNIYLFEQYGTGTTMDVTRMAAQVVSGIGFLGAGAIIRSGTNVTGLTTAASLWVVASIGLATGCGFWLAALVVTVLAILGLATFKKISGLFINFRKHDEPEV